MNRKQRRAAKKVMGEKATSTLDLMTSLDKCCVCEAQFDKKSREHAMTWYVEVFKTIKKVDLYCPNCKEQHDRSRAGTVTTD
jgi:hypothetical protein